MPVLWLMGPICRLSSQPDKSENLRLSPVAHPQESMHRVHIQSSYNHSMGAIHTREFIRAWSPLRGRVNRVSRINLEHVVASHGFYPGKLVSQISSFISHVNNSKFTSQHSQHHNHSSIQISFPSSFQSHISNKILIILFFILFVNNLNSKT